MAASISASQEVCAEGDNNNNEEVAGKTAPGASQGKQDRISGPEVLIVSVPCSVLAAVCLRLLPDEEGGRNKEDERRQRNSNNEATASAGRSR